MVVLSAYRGSLGTTRKEHVHVTCTCGSVVSAEVYRCVDVSVHAEIGHRLRSLEPGVSLSDAFCLNPDCHHRDVPIRLAVPVIYHDPERQLFVLILPEAQRHGELAARAKLLQDLDRDPAAIPAYVLNFSVVFGAAGLDQLLRERQAKDDLKAHEREQAETLRQGFVSLEGERAELSAQSAELELMRAAFEHRDQELGRRNDELTRREAQALRRIEELDQRERELDQRARDLDQRSRELEQRAVEFRTAQDAVRQAKQAHQVPTGRDTEPVQALNTPRRSSGSAGAGDKTQIVPFSHTQRPAATEAGFPQFDDSDEPVTGTEHSFGADGLQELDVSEAVELEDGEVVVLDVSLSQTELHEPPSESWVDSGEPSGIYVDGTGSPRVCVTAGSPELEMLLEPRLDLRVQLHRFPSFAVVALTIGSSASLDGKRGAPIPVSVLMNLEQDVHRKVLGLLAKSFNFHVDVYDRRYALQARRLVTARLEDNVALVSERAKAHLGSIEPRQRDLADAIGRWAAPDYDRHGWNHPERSEFRRDKLTDLSTAQTLRRALAMAVRFSKPEREEYLFAVRGYPVGLWYQQRRAVLQRALDLGIWIGERMVPIALELGMAANHAELVATLRHNFQLFTSVSSPVNDLDEDAASDNWAALEEEAKRLAGVSNRQAASVRGAEPIAPAPRTTPIASSADPAVSGTIGGNSRAVKSSRNVKNASVDELIAALAEPDQRVEAAVELTRRRETRTIEPVMAAVWQMNRSDAVRVLSAVPNFGDEATDALIGGLANHKGFVRQGSALALSVLRNETALEAVSDQVISEPTVIWKEMARGLGTIGPSAIMPLVSRLSRNDEGAHERVAWALAHIAVRGGKRQVTQLAHGRDPLASSVARRALELMSHAKRDDLQVRGHHTPKEQTVNRAFSRRFFQALEASSPVVDAMATMDLKADLSSPAMLLDEADFLEAAEYEDDAAELLDESDLIPT